MKTQLILVLFALFCTACAPKHVRTQPQPKPTSPSWKAAPTIAIKQALPKGHAIALPHAISYLKRYAAQRCAGGICPVLVTTALYWNGKSVRKVRFVLFHHSPLLKTPSVVQARYLNSTTPTLVYSCWTTHWPESMHKYAPWLHNGGNQLVDYSLPSTKYQGTTYHWYVLRPEDTGL